MVIAQTVHCFDDYIILRPSRLSEKCPDSEFFWFVFSSIWTEYGEIQRYSVQRQKNKHGHFSRSVKTNHLWALMCIYMYLYIQYIYIYIQVIYLNNIPIISPQLGLGPITAPCRGPGQEWHGRNYDVLSHNCCSFGRRSRRQGLEVKVERRGC